jgi:hypothetical protein
MSENKKSVDTIKLIVLAKGCTEDEARNIAKNIMANNR